MKPFQRSARLKLLIPAILFSALHAQSIVANLDQIAFTAQADGSVQPQVVSLSSTGASLNLTVSVITYNNSGSWLYASPGVASTPTNLVVSANARNMPNGIYNGAVMITSPGAPNSPFAIPVALTVGSVTPTPASGLAVTPVSLSFQGIAGGVAPATQQLSITSTPSGLGFTATAATTDGNSWLQVSSNIINAPTVVVVGVNTAGLLPGTYNGSITFTPVTGTATTVPVTLTLGGNAQLSVNVSSLQFFYQMQWFTPPYQSFDVSSTGAPIPFSIVASTTSAYNWLSVTPGSGNTKQTVTVSAVPGSLGPGTYTGKIVISSTTLTGNIVEIPVTLTVSNSPLLTASSNPAPFVYQTGGAVPAAQSIQIGSSSSPIPFAVTTSVTTPIPWLGVTPLSGTTPQNLSIIVSPSGLDAGTYSGTISVAAAGVANSPLKIPVTLTVSSASQITASLSSLLFNYQLNGQSQVYAQSFQVGSTGAPVDVTIGVSTTSCGVYWLRAYQTQITTPRTVTIAFDPVQVSSPGSCQGVVTLTGGGSVLTLPVTLLVATTPMMNVTPLSLNLSAQFEGTPSAPQTLQVTMTDASAAPLSVVGNTASGGNWLGVTLSSNSTPSTISVTADPGSLGAGTYTGQVVISSTALTAARTIPVTFTVVSTDTATVTPGALAFSATAGAAAPPAQNVMVASVRGSSLAFAATPSADNSGSWLKVAQNTGTTPASVAIAVDPTGLTPGVYSGRVSFTIPGVANNPVIVPVTLTVTNGQSVSVTPANLAFTYQAGGAPPASQKINVTSSGLGASVTAEPSASGNWLSVSPLTATTPTFFTVTVSPGGLQPGSYTGSIKITSPGAAGSPFTIPVRLDVSAAPAMSIAAIASAASGLRTPISPGEIVILGGAGLGPVSGVNAPLTASGPVPATVSGVTVYFDEFAAPLLYVSAAQINAIVPYEIAGRATVKVAVDYQGTRTDAFIMQTAKTAPALFTATQSGRGQGAILNQDSSYNGSTNPAARGSVVQVFGTGEGLMNPAAVTGSVTQGIVKPQAPVSATIGGVPAIVTFAGAAPGQVAGLFQVNVQVPNAAGTGDQPVVIQIGDLASQTGVTVAIR